MSLIENYLELSRQIISTLNNIHIGNTQIINNNISRQINYENNMNLENNVNLLHNLIQNINPIQNRNPVENVNVNENDQENANANANPNENNQENVNENTNDEENETILNNIRNQILSRRGLNVLERRNRTTPPIITSSFRENNSFRLRRNLNSRHRISPTTQTLQTNPSLIELPLPVPPPPPPPPPPTHPPLSTNIRTHINLEPPPGIFSRRDTILSTDEIINLIRQRGIRNDVIIRPTLIQIREATKLHIYKDISYSQQTQCPISLTPFQDEDLILEIIYCKHIFKDLNLRRHFRTSVKCPLCRFDIRNHEIAIRSLQNEETKT